MAERSVDPLFDEGGGEVFEPFQITCLSCDHNFLFTSGEQRFFKAKGLTNRPKRCRSCRLARKAAKSSAPARASASTPAPLSRPVLRPSAVRDHLPKYSLSIPTILGLIVEADRTGFSSAIEEGRVVYIRSSRPVQAGTYVSFTKSTTKREYHLHEVLGPGLPQDASRSLPEMKASVLEVQEGTVTLRVHFNNAQVLCTAPSFAISNGQRVLFTPSWADGQLEATAITKPDLSLPSLGTSRSSVWGSPNGPSATNSRAMTEVIHPQVSSQLMTALGVSHDLTCHPSLTSARFGFVDASSSHAVPRKGLLYMEDHCVRVTGSGGDSKASSPADANVPPATYLLLGSRSSGHLLTEYLRENFAEIDSLGLERKLVVLYPVEEGTTPANLYGTLSSKLFQSRLLPIRKIEVLKEPLPLAQAYSYSDALTGKITSQHMVAVHYAVSSDLSLDPHPPVGWLELEGSSLSDLALDSSKLPENSASSVKFSVPRDTFGLDAISEALPGGTLLHAVGHSMAASYTTYEAVFSDAGLAEHFVGIIGKSNRSHTGPQWLAAPHSEYWGGDKVFTFFTSKDFNKNEFYRMFQTRWAFAVNHTQIRFSTDLSLSEICEVADRANRTRSKRMSFFRLYGDGKGFILFGKGSRTNPIFPGEAAAPSEAKTQLGSPGGHLPIFVHNVPLSLPYRNIEGLIQQLAPGATPLSFSHGASTLSVRLVVEDADLRASLLARPCRKLDKHYLFLSVDGLDPSQAATSYVCSGQDNMQAISQACSPAKARSEAASSESPASVATADDQKMPETPESSPVTQPRSARDKILEVIQPAIAKFEASPELVDIYLADYDEGSLLATLQDPEARCAFTSGLVEFVRAESIESSFPGNSSEDDTDSPDTHEDGKSIGNYDFSTPMEEDHHDLSPSARRSKKPRNQ